MFEKAVPEDLGIRSINIADFLKEVKEARFNMHSLLILRHGKIAAEVYDYPYRRNDKRLVYSTSKTFTSTAVGVAVKEGLLSVEDRVLDYFKEYDTEYLDPKLNNLTIRNLLMMATGHGQDSIPDICNGGDDWVKTFLTREMTYEPGTRFVYDSGGTYMLSEIISHVTGMKMADYLKKKVLDPLEIEDFLWETHGDVNTGAWGVLIRPCDLLKLGVLYLNKGKWNEEQILTEEWVETATSNLIPTGTKQYASWSRGYGYQIWRNNENSFRADGAFGQSCMVFPEEDMVIVITSEESDSSRVFPLIEKHLLSGLSEEAYMRNAKTYEIMLQRIKQYERPVLSEPSSSYLEYLLPERHYFFKEEHKMEQYELDFYIDNDKMAFEINGKQRIESSNTSFCEGETAYVIMPPTASPIIGEEQRTRKWNYSAHHKWIDDGTLEVDVIYRETGHIQKWLFTFTGNNLITVVSNSCKKLVDMVPGVVSDKNMEFADKVFFGKCK